MSADNIKGRKSRGKEGKKLKRGKTTLALSSDAASSTMSSDTATQKMVVAYDFRGVDPGKLTVRTGETVIAGKEAPGGWLLCQNEQGDVGYVPKSFLKAADEKPPAAQAAAVDGQAEAAAGQSAVAAAESQRVVLYDFAGDGQSRLTVAAGDVVTAVKTGPGGWTLVLDGNGKKGYVPERFLKRN